jgi:hypothetical protein
MKYYKSKNNNNFITDDFSDVMEYESILGKDLIKKLNESYYNINHYLSKKNKKNTITNYTKFTNEKNQNIFLFSISDGTNFYEDNSNSFKSYHLKHKKGFNKVNNYCISFTPETEFKNISTYENYLFFHIPKDFILDNLTRTLTNTNLNNFKKFGNDFTKLNSKNLDKVVELIIKYDKKYPEILKYMGTNKNKFQEMVRWRADFDLDFYMSLYQFGIYNPIINDDKYRFFWNGTHRAAYGATLNYDIPNFVYYTKEEKSDGVFYRISPPIFDGKCGLFEFDLDKKIISVIFEEKDNLDFINLFDDGCDIQSFNVKDKNNDIKKYFIKNKNNIFCKIDYTKSFKSYSLNSVRYLDNSIKNELKNFEIYNEFQLQNLLENRNKNLYEIKDFCSVWDFIGEFGSPVSITYPKQLDRNFYKGDYVYIEIPFGIYKDFVHGWTDDICTKYLFQKNHRCDCYKCLPENKSHMTLKEVREYIRSSKKWKNKKNTISSSYENYLSLKYLGVHRPIVNFKSFLHRGLHRALFLSETNSDIPNLFKIDKTKEIHTIISEKPYFKFNKYLLLDIDITEKELSIHSSLDKKTRKQLLTKISYK